MIKSWSKWLYEIVFSQILETHNSFFSYDRLGMYVHGSPDYNGALWSLNDSSMVDSINKLKNQIF